MNRFNQKQKRSHPVRSLLAAAAVFAAAAAVLMRGVSSISTSAGRNQAESLRLAILRSAVHCYAMEGTYPESLDYLKDNYGISWNPEKYVVDYEIMASNLMPSVTIIPLTDKEAF